MNKEKNISRRTLLRLIGITITSTLLSACKAKKGAANNPSTDPNNPSLNGNRSENMPSNTIDKRTILFVGTYTKDLGFVYGTARGISTFRMDTGNGTLVPILENVGIESPAFLAFHPNKQYLYAVNESSDFVSSFSIDQDPGHLTQLNQQPTLGSSPCFVNIDKTGKWALVTNYTSGNVLVYPIESDGKLGTASDNIQHKGSGPDKTRQEGPHAHSIWIDSSNRYALACDLGLDKVFVYELDVRNGKLLPHSEGIIHPGAGPRHLDFHPNGKFAYVINEIDATMSVMSWDNTKGELKEIQFISTLPVGVDSPKACADVHVHPNGKFLYGSNRGHDSIVIYAIDAANGKLSLIGHEATRGKTPRNFVIDPTSQFLLAANQDTGSIVIFNINPQTGNLSYLRTYHTPTPVCLKFLTI